MRLSSIRKIIVWAFFTLLAAQIAPAQQTIDYASLSGRVTDPTGAVVQGAQVTACQTDTGLTSSVRTDREGRFRFPYLRVGRYEITVHQQGFAETVRSVTLTIGSAFEMPVSLALRSTRSRITVNSQGPVLEMARSQIAGTISQTEVRNLPLNGRSFLDLTLLVPGVSPTNTATSQLFPETSAVPGQGISVSSQRNFSNSFIVDGLSANDDAAGLVGAFYGLDVVQELQVVTSGGQAEFGRALGGYVNVVTKSGTNSLHGDMYGFFENQGLSADNALTNTKLPLTQTQYGASLGGPVIKDHTFYFANFEQRLLNQDGLITIPQAAVNAINSKLTVSGYPGPQIATGLYPNPVHMSNAFGKVDDQISPSDQLSARYSLYDVHSSNSRFSGGLGTVSAGAELSDLDQTLAVSNVYTLSPCTVNETRAQFTNSNLAAPANDPIGPAVSISGVASFGTASGSPTARLNRLAEVVDNLSHQAGAHAIRVGAEFLYNDLTITYPRSVRGSYSFSSLANFQNGVYSTFTQTFGSPVIPQSNPNIGLYGQDEWQVNPHLTLNAGLRYDLEFLKTITTDTNNFSPRLGLAWSPFASRRTVVRASFGLFYDRVPLRPLANALLSAGNTTNLASIQQLNESLASGQTEAPAFPNILPSGAPGVLVSFSTMNPHMQNAEAAQASLEIEQQIGLRGSLSINYQHLRGSHLITSINQNVPTCTAAVDPVNLCRPNPAYQNNSQYASSADSQYDGLSLSFVQRPVKWGSLRASYTYSKALDDVGEFFFSAPINNFNIRQDWGRSDDDQRHRVDFDATLHSSMNSSRTLWQHVSHGFQLSGILRYDSALPFTIVSGLNTIQQTSGRPCAGLAAVAPQCTLPLMIGRNTGIGFGSFNFDTRLSRVFPIGERFHLEIIAELFNALNHPNLLIPNTTFGSGVYPTDPRSTFGQATAVGAPRQAQLALRLTF